MSAKWMGYFFDETDLQGSELLLALAIADHADADGFCYPTMKKLAQKVRLKERQTRNVLRKLEEKNIVKIIPGKGRGNPTQFQLQKGHLSTAITEVEKGQSDDIKRGNPVQEKGQSDGTPLYKGFKPSVEPSINLETKPQPNAENEQASDSVAVIEKVFSKTPSISCQEELRAAGIKNLHLWEKILRTRKAGMTDSQFETFSYFQKSIGYALQDYQAQATRSPSQPKKSRYTPHGTIEIDWNDPRNPFLGQAVIE